MSPKRITARPVGVILTREKRIETQRAAKHAALEKALGDSARIEHVLWTNGPYGHWLIKVRTGCTAKVTQILTGRLHYGDTSEYC